MKNLLIINSSPRTTRSKTRRLTAHYASLWRGLNPEGTVTERDLGANPPSFVDEAWIAAAFTAMADLTPSLRESDALIAEIVDADAVVLGVPMYNFGFPASLKAYFDQIMRIGRTFELTEHPANPYRPLLASKPCFVIVSASDGSIYPGGRMEHLNFLEPYLRWLLTFIGLADPVFVRVVEEEVGRRREEALLAAERTIEDLVGYSARSGILPVSELNGPSP